MKEQIVHIGLKKTGSSYLAKNFFPYLKEFAGYTYKPRKITKLLDFHRFYGLDKKKLNFLKTSLKKSKIFVSMNNFTSDNPENWDHEVSKLHEVYGYNTNVIICLRNTKDFYRSIFLQQIGRSRIIDEKNFFLNDNESSVIKRYPYIYSRFINVDRYDYQILIKILKSRFKKVTVIPYSKINDFNIWAKIFKIKDTKRLKILFKKKPENISMCSLGVKILQKREKFLKILNLKSQDYKSSTDPVDHSLMINRSLKKKYKQNYLNIFLKNFFSIFIFFLKTDFIIKFFKNLWVCRFLKKYRIPSDLYLNEKLIKKNDLFIKKHEKRLDSFYKDKNFT